MTELEELNQKVDDLERRERELERTVLQTEQENLSLRKIQGQLSLVKILFIGLFGLLVLTALVVTSSQFLKSTASEDIKMFFQFFERILLVLAGIASTAMANLFRSNDNGGE